MQPTAYPHVNALLDHLLPQLQAALGASLVGLYLYGSAVTGDFDDDLSDVDLLAAVSGDLNDAEFAALDLMHKGIVTRYPAWDNRIEIAYLSLRALQTFRTDRSPIGIISPGEPFHVKDAGIDWLMNWYLVREHGITLFGPPPQTVIAPVSKAEFIQSVKDHARSWRDWIDSVRARPYQAYTILTMCRALYTATHGEHVSKQQAAQWAQQALPEWAPLIAAALAWRKAAREDVADHAATLPETRRFVSAMIDRIVS